MEKDIRKALREGALEVYSMFFNVNEVFFRPFVEQEIDSLYHEKKDPVYGEPIPIVASLNFNPEEDEVRDERGSSIKIDCDFEVPTEDLYLKGIFPKYTLRDLRKGVIEYQGDLYNVLVAKPITPFDDTSAFIQFRTVLEQ